MGKVASRLTRPMRLFNIENRASRTLEKQHAQGIAAPKHPSTISQISELQHENQNLFAKHEERNEALHEKLKGLYVETDHTIREMKSSTRPLPESRQANPETDLGIMDISHPIPEGRADLKTILHFIGQHQIDPDNVTSESIAHDYNLDKDEVEKILTYFKACNLYLPQEMYKKNPKLKKIVADQINKMPSNPLVQIRLHLPKDDSSRDSDSNNSKT